MSEARQLENAEWELLREVEAAISYFQSRELATVAVEITEGPVVWEGWWKSLFRRQPQVQTVQAWYLGVKVLDGRSVQVVVLDNGQLAKCLQASPRGLLKHIGAAKPSSLDDVQDLRQLLRNKRLYP